MIVTPRLIQRPGRDADLGPFTAQNADPEVMRYLTAVLILAWEAAVSPRVMAGEGLPPTTVPCSSAKIRGWRDTPAMSASVRTFCQRGASPRLGWSQPSNRRKLRRGNAGWGATQGYRI